MHVNNEQTNTQKMLQHNQAKERIYSGSLQRKLVDLINLDGGKNNIDIRESTILNCVDYSVETLKSLFGSPSSVTILSDVDPQLLIKIKFIEKVDCNQLVFSSPSRFSQDASLPRTIRIFVNRSQIDFSDVSDDSIPPAVQIELPFEYPKEGFVVPLVGTKFGRVASIEIFVEDNYGTEITEMGNIKLEGFLTPTYHVEYK